MATTLDLISQLSDLGFSQKESSVYVALIGLGRGTVSEISRKAGINRTTGYDILSTLSKKGIVRVSGKEPKQEYVAEPPTSIALYLKNQAEVAQKNIEVYNSILPELNSHYSTEDKPKIRFYEGIEGVEQVYEDTLTSHEPIRAYATLDDMFKALPHYFPKYYKRRADKGISIRAIVPKTTMGIERKSFDAEEKREIALIPKDTYYFSPEINIYDNKVMIASWREKLGIIIESTEIADAMKKIYELAWKEAKRLDIETSK